MKFNHNKSNCNKSNSIVLVNQKKTVSAFNNNYIQYESIGDKDKNLSIKEYIHIIRPYLSDTMNNNKTQGEWKIHLTMAINLISSNDSDETCTMHTKKDDIEIMMT